jgi:hypothetical protein
MGQRDLASSSLSTLNALTSTSLLFVTLQICLQVLPFFKVFVVAAARWYNACFVLCLQISDPVRALSTCVSEVRLLGTHSAAAGAPAS